MIGNDYMFKEDVPVDYSNYYTASTFYMSFIKVVQFPLSLVYTSQQGAGIFSV